MIITKVTTGVPVPVPTDPGAPEPAQSMPPSGLPDVGASVYLTGVDGSVWDLLNGPVQLLQGPTGFLPSNVAHRWKTSPMLNGATRAGYSVGTQRLSLPVLVGSDSALGWRDLDASLWRALGNDAQCRVTVVAPDAGARVMPAWFTGVGDNVEYPIDPLSAMWAQYRLEFEAEEPYWQGASTVQTIRPSTPAPYYAPPGSAFVKTLMPANSTGSATLRNEGDVDVWPVYAVSGAVAGFVLGVGGATITYGAVADGTTVWIDTHPARQTVGYSRGDNNETAWLGVTTRDFAAVPPGADVPFTATLTTPGANASVSVELTPRYRRPW